MAIVLVEGGYRNVKTCYMRKLPAPELIDDADLPANHYVLFDEDGRKCVCSYERHRLFYWADEKGIKLVTVQ